MEHFPVPYIPQCNVFIVRGINRRSQKSRPAGHVFIGTAAVAVGERGIVGKIRGIEQHSRAGLLQIADTLNPFRPVAHLVQGGQKHTRQYRDDRYHDEELYQGEIPSFLSHCAIPSPKPLLCLNPSAFHLFFLPIVFID